MLKAMAEPGIQDFWDALRSKGGIIIWSSVLLLLLWGPKGVPMFSGWFSGWLTSNPAVAAYRIQLVSIAFGIILLVLVPLLIVRALFAQTPSEYGLGLGNIREGVLLMSLLFVCALPFFYLASADHAMWSEYPMIYRGLDLPQIMHAFNWQTFLIFEAAYLGFFLVIEFTFRSYLLFGLIDRFGPYAILLQLLPYCIWHLTKPFMEFAGTPVWGIAVAVIALRVRSIYYIVLPHWALNVFLDIMILHRRHVF